MTIVICIWHFYRLVVDAWCSNCWRFDNNVVLCETRFGVGVGVGSMQEVLLLYIFSEVVVQYVWYGAWCAFPCHICFIRSRFDDVCDGVFNSVWNSVQRQEEHRWNPSSQTHLKQYSEVLESVFVYTNIKLHNTTLWLRCRLYYDNTAFDDRLSDDPLGDTYDFRNERVVVIDVWIGLSIIGGSAWWVSCSRDSFVAWTRCRHRWA